MAPPVEQLGLGLRAANDSKLIKGRSYKVICEDLAPFLSTKQKEELAPKSLRSNSYTGETSDKIIIIGFLEKMIWFIKDY